MASLLVIGECMMELRAAEADSYRRAFAGDTYNSAVYAKRWQQSLQVSMYSSVGRDAISESMIAAWEQEGVDASLVTFSDDRLPGIYAISTDEQGERNFSYWREGSAATQMMTLLERSGGTKTIPDFDYVYFSGLSLAILDDEDKQRLLDLVSSLRRRGAKIAFDPNYREKLWKDSAHAAYWMTKSYRICDIALPGVEDHMALYAHDSVQSIGQFLKTEKVEEIVIKGGRDGVFCYHQGLPVHHQIFSPAAQQIDSTAAGDSFAGTYLAARLMGSSCAESATAAAAVAKLVVQYPGAIIDSDKYEDFLANFERSFA